MKGNKKRNFNVIMKMWNFIQKSSGLDDLSLRLYVYLKRILIRDEFVLI